MNLHRRKRHIRSILRYGSPLFVPLGCPEQSLYSPCHLTGNGGRLRHPNSKRHIPPVRVQSYHCTTHRRYVTFIPEEVLPRIHYAPKVVTQSVEDHLSGQKKQESRKPHVKTVKRWVKRLAMKLEKVKAKAIERLGFEGYD